MTKLEQAILTIQMCTKTGMVSPHPVERELFTWIDAVCIQVLKKETTILHPTPAPEEKK